MSTGTSVLMHQDITSDISNIPQEEYLNVASIILKVDPKERKEEQVLAMQKLTEELQFFKSMNQKKSNIRNRLHYKICSKMKYEQCKKGQAIIEYGAKADKFYVLLKGSVIVFLTKSPDLLHTEINEELQHQQERNIPSLSINTKDLDINRRLSVASNNSLSPVGKLSIFKQIPNAQNANQSNQKSRMSSSSVVFSDLTSSPQRASIKNNIDSPLNLKTITGESSDANNKEQILQLNTKAELGRQSIQLFESINIQSNTDSIQNSQNEKNGNTSDQTDKVESSSKMRLKKVFGLIKQQNKTTDQIQIDSSTKQEDNSQNNSFQNTNQSQSSNSQVKSIFGKFISTMLKSQTNQISVTQQDSSEKVENQSQQKSNENDQLTTVRQRFNEKYMYSRAFGSLNAADIEQPEKLIHLPSFVFKYYFRTKLEEGSTFGELGLLDNKPRSAFIICSEDCEFGVMDKDDYQKLLGCLHRREIERKFNFLKENMLQELTNQAIKKIFYSFQKIKVQKNEYLFKQGSLSDGIYIIKKGEIKLEKVLTYSETIKSEEEELQMRKKNCFNKKNIPFATLGIGEYFGEEFLIFDFKTQHYRSYSAVAVSLKVSLYFIQNSSFATFVKQFPDSFMAFKKNVKVKIQRRQEYMQNIETNYKELMKQKELVTNQKQTEAKIIQTISSQKSFTELNSFQSPISSPLLKKQSILQSFKGQQSNSFQQGGESPILISEIRNNNERKSLIQFNSAYLQQSNSISLFDLDSQFNTQLDKKSSDNLSKLKTLQVIEQNQIDEEDEQNKQDKSQQQSKLIKLVSTKDQRSSLNYGQISKLNEIQEENKNNFIDSSPTQQNYLICDYFQDERSPTSPNQQQRNAQQKTLDSKFQRSSHHSKTTSCIFFGNKQLQIDAQNSILQSQFLQNDNETKNKAQSNGINTQSFQQQRNSIGNPQKQNQVIRQEKFETHSDVHEFLDIKYSETMYNPEKLGEVIKSVEDLKSKKKNSNMIENQMKFLYDKNSKETEMRIDHLKQKISNQYRLDLNHQNDAYNKNRQNIYSNSNSKTVDKVTKLQVQYLKKQDGFDKLIRNYFLSNQQKNVSNSQELQQTTEQQKQIEKDFGMRNSQEVKFQVKANQKNQNDKINLDMNCIVDNQNTTELMENIQNINMTDSVPFTTNKNSQKETDKKTHLKLKTMDCSSPSLQSLQQQSPQFQSPSKQSPQKQSSFSIIQQSPLKQSRSSYKFTYPLQQQASPLHSNQNFNFQVLKYKSSNENASSQEAQQQNEPQQKHANLTMLLNSENQFTNFTDTTQTSSTNPQQYSLQAYQKQKQNNQKHQEVLCKSEEDINVRKSEQNNFEHTKGVSLNITPALSQRKNQTANGGSRQQNKSFTIKSSSNLSTQYSKNFSPFKTYQTNQNPLQLSTDSPLSNKQDETKQQQSYFFQHRKTQSTSVFQGSPSLYKTTLGNIVSQKNLNVLHDSSNDDSYDNKQIKRQYSSMINLNEQWSNTNVNSPQNSSQDNIQKRQLLNSQGQPNQSKYKDTQGRKFKRLISEFSQPKKDLSQSMYLSNQQFENNHILFQPQFQTNQKCQTEVFFNSKSSMQSTPTQKQISLNTRKGFQKPMQIYKGSSFNQSLNLKKQFDNTETNTKSITSPQNKQVEQNIS